MAKPDPPLWFMVTVGVVICLVLLLGVIGMVVFGGA